MAEEFDYLTYGAFHGEDAMEELLERYRAELREGYVLVIGLGGLDSEVLPMIEKSLPEPPRMRAKYGGRGSGGGFYTRKFGERLLLRRRDLAPGEFIEVRSRDATAAGRGEIFAELKSKQAGSGEEEERETPDAGSDTELEEIRKLLWESRQLGEQIRQGIDSLKERSPAK
jgi:hypothetical protein